MSTLERRVETLERTRAHKRDAIDTIVRILVKPGLQHLEPQVAGVYGETLKRLDGESVDDFRGRAKILAHKLRPPEDLVATFTLRPLWEDSHG